MPLRRYIFNTLTVVSLLLLLVTVGLWVDGRTHDTGGHLPIRVGQMDSALVFNYHGACLQWGDHLPPTWGRTSPWHSTWYRSKPEPFMPIWPEQWYSYIGVAKGVNIAGFQYIDRTPNAYGRGSRSLFLRYEFVLPYWFLTLIFAALPAIWLLKWNKRRKLGPNSCPGCGYDLTGNESGACPECGVA